VPGLWQRAPGRADSPANQAARVAFRLATCRPRSGATHLSRLSTPASAFPWKRFAPGLACRHARLTPAAGHQPFTASFAHLHHLARCPGVRRPSSTAGSHRHRPPNTNTRIVLIPQANEETRSAEHTELRRQRAADTPRRPSGHGSARRMRRRTDPHQASFTRAHTHRSRTRRPQSPDHTAHLAMRSSNSRDQRVSSASENLGSAESCIA